MLLDILLRAWSTRKAFKRAAAARLVFNAQGEEVLRNAMAYAFEVGQGQPLAEEVILRPMNPFSDPNWRNGVMPTGSPANGTN